MEKLDLRGKPCEEFILEISKYLVAMKVGDSILVLTDKDRVLCTHQLLRNAPRYLFKADVVDDYAEITIKRLR
ncbi:conserved hypothetical protein [Sulfolobus islandicus Y.G.57.14]|jgi:TusA-related sulfurtransferase|uniref:Uncharacterized protein n=10 Tax=Saccharolobus islandicus TaxID=43080 RepID=M9UAL2_SACIS|nr:hypothetical protein [Sulfolobus islandicus]ACP35922.1 conserved hypothetical protein [Sulfolobus islandicus L.S.2.15]ACP38532.1 conserved hypothetical protein [Sulfolobus islandicus M.14.25]ACP46160.1 conserved hypothetical protein [Sulfolobus islandicus Y.G.57.14]ACP48128.1 conserved hypothetical protein [Sulfolobus islandicus Y.N.15.51]ACP55776.1 conserved hypothetical protein [Sulfolobus islandicus M.16.27]